MDRRTIIIAGPSAVGKTHLANMLVQLYPQDFVQAKLYTTRKPRNVEFTTDRIFVPKEEFDYLEQTGKFLVHGEFANNWYGFTREALQPVNKHILVNAWPALLDQFHMVKNPLIIGLQATRSGMGLLEMRMRARGDSEEIIQIRKDIILRDMGDLEARRAFVQKNGKFFEITDDHGLRLEVIPWLETTLGLKG